MVLLGSSDSGAVKYLFCISKYLKVNKWVYIKNKKKLIKNLNYIEFKNLYKLKKINLIITGAALGNSVDNKLIRFGKKNKIFTVSVLDHWTNYSSRFFYRGKKIYPDKIFINDQYSYQKALDNNFPKEKLLIMKNIYLEKLSQSKFKKKLSSWAKKIKDKKKRIIIFISEQIKKDFNFLKSEYKLNEFETLKKIISQLSINDLLIIKNHPEESYNKFKKFLSRNVCIKKNITFSDLIYLPDKIIGIKSILLLELSMFRKDIISFRPLIDNGFIGDKYKNVHLVRKNINAKLYFKKNNFKKSFLGAKKKILTFLREYQ